MKDLIKDIRESLEGFADEKRIEFAKISYPTKMHVIGVTVPNLKIALKELSKQTKLFKNQEKLSLVKQLIDEDVFELQQIAFEYLQTEKNLYKSLTEDFIESIRKNLDNWLSVDYFGALVVGCAWRENLISTEKVKEYLNSDDFWIRRIAIVATVSLNQKARGGYGDTKRTLEICQLVVDDHQETITKALSWALRELAKIDKKSTIDFIDENKSRLHKRVLREVNNKLNNWILLILLMIPLFLNGCLSLPTLQTGKTVGENNLEYAISGTYGKYSQNSILDFEGDFDYKPVVGLRVNYGWSDRFDLGVNISQSTFVGPCFKYQFLGNQNSKFAASIGLEGSFSLGAFVFGSFTNYLTTPLFLSAHPTDKFAFYFTPRLIHTSEYVFASETTDDLLGPGPKLNLFGHSYGIVFGRKYKFAIEVSNFDRHFFKPTQISLGYIYSFRD